MTSPPRDGKPVKKAVAKKAARKRTLKVAPPPVEPTIPDPLRPLGLEGRRMWDRIWEMKSKWVVRDLDIDHVAMLCESVDERVSLRVRVLREGEWRDRVALRALDEQIDRMMGTLGMNPSERARMNVAVEVALESDPLAKMRARYASNRSTN